MNSPIVHRRLGQTTFTAVIMGTLSMLYAWKVLYPSRHTGSTGSPLLIGFEVVKATVLLPILGRVYIRNRKENDQVVRANHVYVFGTAAALSLIIHSSIRLFNQ
jgi:hypothetical protein